ncbi:sensor domain-containing diguanylate cyclase [Chitiniphilus eburneus]|uniref:Diguanylate cyclase n=1 Tax=Chitiniphilus eburneus TaxID=2571148 RepID=A0A4U0PWQ0_9NEIS|nr:sensor domain-containing diguanylate cyclase [Chitiniphilus eburneus]TJZ72965.1 diguanylate cyclase [Chitiniphilus eburneus]
MGVLRHKSIYLGVFLAWLALTLAVLAVYAGMALSQARQDHQRLHQQFQDRLGYQFAGIETALEAFAAFQSVPRNHTFVVDRSYARQLLVRYPYVAGLQLIRRVPAADAKRFTDAMRGLGETDFRLHTLDPDRQPLPRKANYYPVVFSEPANPATHGLDVAEVVGTMPRESQQVIVTRPFRLPGGELAYMMVRPASFAMTPEETRRVAPLTYVGVLVKTAPLVPGLSAFPAGLTVSVRRADQTDTELVHSASAAASALETRWFPRLALISRVPSSSQPYVLETRWQLGWSTLDRNVLTMLAGVLGLLLLALLGIVRLARLRHFARIREAAKLAHMAAHDALTGLSNRRTLDVALDRSVAQNTPCSLVFLDLDRFKPINDNHGHDAGDHVLKMVAERLSLCVRANDTLARWGGDEFALLLPGDMNAARERELLRRLTQALMEPIRWGEQSFSIGASLGVAHYPQDGTTVKQVLQAADQRMYRHKEARRSNPLAPPPPLAGT